MEREERRLSKELENAERLLSRHQAQEEMVAVKQATRGHERSAGRPWSSAESVYLRHLLRPAGVP